LWPASADRSIASLADDVLAKDNDSARNWTRLPKQYLVGSLPRRIERIVKFPSRGRTAANALRFYVYIAAIRDRKTNAATVGYTRLVEVLGFDRAGISNAISLLIEHQLITVRNNKTGMLLHDIGEGSLPPDVYDSTNMYFLRGFSKRREPGAADALPFTDAS
jgi:hypothetical protein